LDDKKPFVYASGRYENEWNKITVAFPIAPAPNSNVLVYDLRYDPTPFIALSEKELADKIFASWEERQKDDFIKLPVKQLQYNRCPAVAPLGVLAAGDGWKKVGLDEATIAKHSKLLLAHPEFAERLRSVFERKREYPASADPEAQLYDGFLNDRDRLRVETVRNASERELADFHPEFTDERLTPLLLHYKARNFPKTLSEGEMVQWEEWRSGRLQRQLPNFMKSLQRLSATADDNKQFMLQELQLWAESILPSEQD
jgi:exodeoxyribonuclease-1